jgi:hypothetical protein
MYNRQRCCKIIGELFTWDSSGKQLKRKIKMLKINRILQQHPNSNKFQVKMKKSMNK